MQNILISIIIPVFNVSKYLSDCLNSILLQKVDFEYEILLVDDGSTDNSGVICEKYAAEYDFIVVFHQKNQGQSVARNRAIRDAKGEYLCFVDSDDMVEPYFLEYLCKYTDDERDVITYNATSMYDKRFESSYKEEQFLYGLENYLKCAIRDYPVETVPWRFTVQRKFFIENSLWFHEGIIHEDCEWCPKLLVKARTISVIYKNLYIYRDSNDGERKGTCIDKTKINHRIKGYETVTKELIRFANTSNLDHIRKEYILRSAAQAMQQYMLLILQMDEYKKAYNIIDNQRIFLIPYMGKKFQILQRFFGGYIGTKLYDILFRKRNQRW